MSQPDASYSDLKRTSLYDGHIALGAKLVPFAGYEMPVQYPMGVLKEHLHTREAAGLFDVSHMGQCFITSSDGNFETAANALEKLVPADIRSLEPGQQRYSQLLNSDGGIIDDLMISRLAFPGHEHKLYLVVNAGRKDVDFKLMQEHMPEGVELDIKDDLLSLIALQGPKAVDVLGAMNPKVKELTFMTHTDLPLGEDPSELWCHVSRSGYTGEDGFEIAVKHDDALRLWNKLMSHPDVEAIGLGARDSLRLEAGLCLYGNDIDETTTPVEAGLNWSIQPRRREEGGFFGQHKIISQLKHKPEKRLVGILPTGRAPARAHTIIQSADGDVIGEITSGGFGPTVGGPVAMGYVAAGYTAPGTPISLLIRGKASPGRVVKMPFVPHQYYRG